MDKLKERWEIIVGYVALIVSLSAFKEDLALINLNLGLFSFNAAQFLFGLILSFLFALNLYLIPFLLSSTRYASIKIFSFLESFAYFMFALLAVSPFFVLFAVGINSLINLLRNIPIQTKDPVISSVSSIIGVVLALISNIIALKYRRQKYSAQKQELEELEIKEFESAQKLFNDEYYSQSILEAFKTLELHLKRLIIQRDLPFRSNKLQDILDVALKLKLISHNDIKTIDQIRKMRNSAAHLDVNFTKAQASEAISFMRDLIKRTSTQPNNSAA
jgi:uncharacterized membrane protein